MSSFLGFMPTGESEYYFVSYNNEDVDRVKPVASMMHDVGIPLWYDYGIEYGKQWANQINERISGAKAVIHIFTKGILNKEESYVQKEHKIAKIFKKKVIVLVLDEINNEDIPMSKADWWVDITAYKDSHCQDKEVLVSIRKAVDSSSSLRSKKN